MLTLADKVGRGGRTNHDSTYIKVLVIYTFFCSFSKLFGHSGRAGKAYADKADEASIGVLGKC